MVVSPRASQAVERVVAREQDPRHGGAVGVGRLEVRLEPVELRLGGEGVRRVRLTSVCVATDKSAERQDIQK